MIISRAAIVPPTVTGRTLEGIAYRYQHPSRVTDNGRDFYLEEFVPGCDTKTITDRAVFPVGWFHPWSSNAGVSPSQPLGAVTFRSSTDEGALIFEARISQTRLGDEALELVRDRAAEDVSVSYKPITTRPGRRGADRLLSRTEIAIRELSLAPTGLGQHEDAKVLAVRATHRQEELAEVVEFPRLEAIQRRARAVFF